MLDAAMRRMIDPPMDRLGALVARTGLTANATTIASLAIGLGVIPALAAQNYALALVLVLINRLGDGLDGAIARRLGVTDLGGYLDIVADFIFYSAVIFGFALARPQDAAWAAFLIFSFVGTGSTFLAYAVMAAKRDIETPDRGRKSFFYLGGLTEGTETIAVFIFMVLWPQHFAITAAAFGTLCWLTTAFRVSEAIRVLR